MPLAPEQVLDRLVAVLPEFGPEWESSENLFREEDGSFTFCGVLAECSHYVREHYERLSAQQRTDLGALVDECMTPPDTELAAAAATCFLENLAFERFSKDFERHLGGAALEIFRRIHGA